MITQRLHFLFCALAYHDVINIATRCRDPNFLESIFTSVRTVFATQNTTKWRIWFVRWRFDAHYLAIFSCSTPSMRAAVRTQSLLLAAMWTSERAKVRWEFAFNVGPTLREIRVLISVRSVRDVVSLADVSGSCVCFTIRRVITQRFHVCFFAFVDVNRVIIATCSLHSQPLEFVDTSVSPIAAFQFALKRVIWFVWRRGYAHYVPDPVALGVPAVRISVRAQRLMSTTMGSSEGADVVRKFFFEFWPPRGKVRILVAVGRICNVVQLADVA